MKSLMLFLITSVFVSISIGFVSNYQPQQESLEKFIDKKLLSYNTKEKEVELIKELYGEESE